MGKVKRGVACTIVGCEGIAVKSVSVDALARSGLKASSTGRAYLCTSHYKEFKRRIKSERALERWRWRK